MNKVRKKFVISAMAALFVMLTVLLGIINGINFTMVAQDADRVTEMIAQSKGTFAPQKNENGAIVKQQDIQRKAMGPDSPELPYSARYYTFRFDKNGNAEEVSFNVSAVTRDQALQTAKSLLKEKTGWVNTVYRYRVYTQGDYTYVTVADFGRELLPSYRILIISLIGETAGLLVCVAFLVYVSKRLFAPLENADRKQKKFIAKAENEFKIPLTVISANVEIIERENGSSDYTRSINRQVKRMTALNRRIAALAVFDPDNMQSSSFDLSRAAGEVCETAAARFAGNGKDFTYDIDPGVTLSGDEKAIRRALEEITDNALQFALSSASFSLKVKENRIIITAANDTDLSDGDKEQAFDRFTRLENAAGKEGNGLGLSFVRETVTAHNGRVSANAENGIFTLKAVL